MIKKEIYTIVNSKGLKYGENEAKLWFNKAKKNPYDPTVVFVENQMLQVGKINQFSYDPKEKDILDYYDKKPLVISLGTMQRNKKRYEIGINLNFIPAPYKWSVLDIIQETYSTFFQRHKDNKHSNNALKQQQIMYNYQLLKAVLKRYGVSFAMRTYIPSRKSKLYVINYNNWVDAAFLSLENFEGISYERMQQEYRDYKNLTS